MKRIRLRKVLGSTLLAVTIVALNPVRASAEWRHDNNGWWYTEGNSYARGLRDIDECELDQDGTWIKRSKEAEEARNLILKEDSNYISKMNVQYGAKLTKSYLEGNMDKFMTNDKWKLPEEDVYVFSLTGSYDDEYNGYMVGKVSKNVYCIPHQGGLSIYQIKNNEIIKTYKWLGDDGASYEWR